MNRYAFLVVEANSAHVLLSKFHIPDKDLAKMSTELWIRVRIWIFWAANIYRWTHALLPKSPNNNNHTKDKLNSTLHSIYVSYAIHSYQIGHQKFR